MAHLVHGASQHNRSDVQCRRLLFRCWHRGTQEGDFILGRFAEAHLSEFNTAQLERLEALLDCSDPDLFDWIVVGITPPKEHDHDVMNLLRAFAQTREVKAKPPRIILKSWE